MGIVAKIQLPNLEDMSRQFGIDIDNLERICTESLERLCKVAEADMRRGLERHKAETGNGVKSLQLKVQPINNGLECELGAYYTHDPRPEDGFYHALFQEYGSPTTQKDPWFRPAADKLKREWKKAVRDAIDKFERGSAT